MLLIYRSMYSWKIHISSLYLIDKLSFPSFSIFSFLLYLPISSSISQIIKELCSFSSYSFRLRHLSFSGIMKETISSQNMTNSIGFSTYSTYSIYIHTIFYSINHFNLVDLLIPTILVEP